MFLRKKIGAGRLWLRRSGKIGAADVLGDPTQVSAEQLKNLTKMKKRIRIKIKSFVGKVLGLLCHCHNLLFISNYVGN